MPPATIHINPRGMIQDQDCRVRASKRNGDTITWMSVGTGGPWTIDFGANSPFATTSFTVPAGPNGTSTQTPRADAASSDDGVKYRYTVKNSSGGTTDDPDVIVEN